MALKIVSTSLYIADGIGVCLAVYGARHHNSQEIDVGVVLIVLSTFLSTLIKEKE